MRIADLDTGLERISQWANTNAFQLPEKSAPSAGYLPQAGALEVVLGRRSLNDQLVALLLPSRLEAGLLEPAVMETTRKELIGYFSHRAGSNPTPAMEPFRAASDLLASEDILFSDVQSALALLLRG